MCNMTMFNRGTKDNIFTHMSIHQNMNSLATTAICSLLNAAETWYVRPSRGAGHGKTAPARGKIHVTAVAACQYHGF